MPAFGKQPPSAHETSHQDGGADEISVAALSGELADDQPPKAHALGGAKHTSATLAALNLLISDATLDDEGDTRTPSAHGSLHEDGGDQEISVAGLSGDLADKQDADKLQGRDVESAAPTDRDILTWIDGSSEWQGKGVVGCRLDRLSNQIISSGGYVDVAFDLELFDTDDIHSLVSNTERMTCQTAGIYQVSAHVVFAANDTGIRFMAIAVNANGADVFIAVNVKDNLGASIPTYLSLTTLLELSVGDYTVCKVLQLSGGNLDVLLTSRYSPGFMMVRIA